MLAKRSFDIASAAILLVIASPLLLVVAALIVADDHGPVFYSQVRLGRGGAIFRMYKFRTMVRNADKIGSYSTSLNDRRITRIGAMLRRFSIDEVPQLYNVLKGDMSMIGPRPDVPAQQALYTPGDFAKRHSVRPGVTGLAQATVRSNATPEQRTRLDLEYVDKMSFLFDLQIIAMTVRQVVFKGGN